MKERKVRRGRMWCACFHLYSSIVSVGKRCAPYECVCTCCEMGRAEYEGRWRRGIACEGFAGRYPDVYMYVPALLHAHALLPMVSFSYDNGKGGIGIAMTASVPSLRLRVVAVGTANGSCVVLSNIGALYHLSSIFYLASVDFAIGSF